MLERKKKFDKEMELLKEEVEAMNEFSEMNTYRDTFPIVNNLNVKITQYREQKIVMEKEDNMMLGFKGNYDKFEQPEKAFLPHFELWIAVFNFLSERKRYHGMKMSDIKHEQVEDLI